MKINLSKQQYKDLLDSVALSDIIFGSLRDAVEREDVDYEERADRMEDLQKYLLEFAGEFEQEEAVMEMHGELYMDDGYFEGEVEPIMDDFEEYVIYDTLPNILAWRDFNREYTDEEQDKMAEENGDFFGVELFPYEERYRHEFEGYGFERLYIKENKGMGTPSPYL